MGLFGRVIGDEEKLLKAVNEAKDLDEICKIAESYGYKITTEEIGDYYMQQVSGEVLVNVNCTTGLR